ncbi:DEAD-box ATP-dependent RNA helicase 31 [Dendrobium catenatum]|uniref:ATP-dependent RNA helicase n=1 Tax=Dendrobium catenatum TaxID=906689 RepID=A0A2I0WTA0_9ASPA|nr:DEAD-box ATP-dependent RNA helicase 31 [Dendrobium catenatum]PKU78888.1 DEAD-box ATP-dependent RNA helicase 31 [Dendrobium catenatum]
MKIAAIFRSSPASFPCVFAKLRLKSLPFSTNQCLLFHYREYSGGRTFSARPARSGIRDIQRGKLRTGSVSGQGKSLIEDEAELSDWISDLKADSFRTRHSSEDEGSGRYRGRQDSKDMGRNWLASKERGRDSRSAAYGRPSSRRNRGSDSDGDSARSQRGSSLRRRLDSDDNVDDFRSRVGNERGSRPAVSSDSRKGLGDRHGASSAFNKRGRGDYEIGGRVSQRKKSQVLVVSEEEEEDEEEEESDDILPDFDNDFFGDKEDRKDRVAKGPIEKGSSRLSNDSNILKAVPQTSVPASDSYLSEARFDQFSLSPLSLKGIKAVGYERMTVVQEATLPVILKGKDVLAKAKTGTGKTVAFLLPAIEVVAKLPPPDRDNRRPPIHVLVICPTRELADQAAAEASKLLRYHASIGVQVVMGGTRLALEQKRMQANPCQILVATPGRLRDHMENTPGFTSKLSGVKVLVLDEADRLLDMGFRKDIEKIVAELPKQRQTLLFSATVSDEVRQICYIAMKRDNEFISTVEEGSEETHSQVTQMHLSAPLDKQFSILYGILSDHIAEDVDYKVIVFCTTAMVTKLVADLLAELNLNVREMHSRKPQTYRTRVSKEFKESKGLILVSSDVSARGVDYPDVSLVIQLGVPADRDQYIHRLGRTGRKGKGGKGLLLLAPWEDFFLDNIRDLPIEKAEVPLIDPDTRKKVERALAHVEMKNKERAYQAWLGYYNSIKNVAREKSKLVLLANEFSRSMGLDNPPAIPIIVLRKMGLNNVPGIRTK